MFRAQTGWIVTEIGGKSAVAAPDTRVGLVMDGYQVRMAGAWLP